MVNIDKLKFSKLENVELKDYFPNESTVFTPWLEANLAELGNALGLNLEPIRREAPVGDLSLDLLAKDIDRSKTVIIENQLGKTDHKHLGQLLTYAAGYDAEIIIWVSGGFRDEYRQVLEWLNEQTNTKIHFFAVVVEIVKIEESKPAINFKCIVSPNEWKDDIPFPDKTEQEQRFQTFFQPLIDELRAVHKFANAKIASGNPFHYFSSGHRGFTYCVKFYKNLGVYNELRVYVRIINQEGGKDRLELFDALEKHKDAISEAFGGSFEWFRYPEKKESQIVFALDGDVSWDTGDMTEIRQWCIEHLLKLKEVFDPEIVKVL